MTECCMLHRGPRDDIMDRDRRGGRFLPGGGSGGYGAARDIDGRYITMRIDY